MATTFDTTTYPLQAATGFKHKARGVLDVMDDNAPRYRTIASDVYADVECVFVPMDDTTSANFLTYLSTNDGTEFEITHNSTTYRGYIRPESWDEDKSETLHVWTFTLYAKVV